MAESPPPRGREAEARRNDALVHDAALAVLSADPAAPMSAVARAAGVGQATLYRRYPHREALLVAVCGSGLAAIGERVAAALDEPDAGRAVTGFLEWYAGSGALRMTALLGSFAPPAELFEAAERANRDMQRLVDRAVDAGAVRPDLTGADLTLLAAQAGALDAGDPERTAQLRRRYLALLGQALTLADAPALPGPAPTAAELEAPWREGRRGR